MSPLNCPIIEHIIIMKHLIPLTPDQLQIVQAGLQSSLKYADSEYIELVDEIMQVIEENS